MDISKVDQLESYILNLIERVSELKDENASLKDKIFQMEKKNSQFIEERDIVKLKVEAMLRNLDKMELEKYEEYHSG